MSKSYTPLPLGACMAQRDSFTFYDIFNRATGISDYIE
jgi:hypothetical protein